MKISTVSQMRNLDKTAVEKYGIKEELLMENAGYAASRVIEDTIGVFGKKFIIFCGPGNNGGDGFVVARKLHSNGGRVKVYVTSDPEKYKGAAQLNYEIMRKIPIDVTQVEQADVLRMNVFHCDCIVDALLGTGIDRAVEGKYREVIELINSSQKPVVSLDIPSGVNGNTGQVMGIAVQADYTITFGLPKIGNVLYPGFELCGQNYVSHISFPPAMYTTTLTVQINDFITLPPRLPDGHKGTFGDVLFIAGAATYFGAPYFAATSHLKAGGGYARLASPRSIVPFLAGKGSEVVYVPLAESEDGSIAYTNKEKLLEVSGLVDMVVIGPGISLNQETARLVRELVAEIDKPVLIDGDGLTAIADDLSCLAQRNSATILTPHTGEMARLTHKKISEITADPLPVLVEMSKKLEAIIVLKGAHSLIAYPDGHVFINMSGNSGMASAGSGDVLTGTIAAMFGLGLCIPEATRKGVFIHGFAGDLAAQSLGEDGVTAQSILSHLPIAMKYEREGIPADWRRKYEGLIIV